MKKAIAWMVRNSVAANLLMLLILLVGLVSFTNVVQEVFPEASLDMVQVRVEYLGASPEEVDEGLVDEQQRVGLGVDSHGPGLSYVRRKAVHSAT